MNLEEFIAVFETELEVPRGTTQPDTRLADISRFDSMGRLSFMNMIDMKMGVLIESGAIDRCKTIADLHAVVAKAAAG